LLLTTKPAVLPLFMLDVKTDGGVLDYSDTPRSS
jgi:hypothetical protein